MLHSFYQHLFCSEMQADLHQSNLQGGKPLRGRASLSDVDHFQLHKWGKLSGWDRNKPGSKQDKSSLSTSSSISNTLLKEPGRIRYPPHCFSPLRVLDAASRGQSHNRGAGGARGYLHVCHLSQHWPRWPDGCFQGLWADRNWMEPSVTKHVVCSTYPSTSMSWLILNTPQQIYSIMFFSPREKECAAFWLGKRGTVFPGSCPSFKTSAYLGCVISVLKTPNRSFQFTDYALSSNWVIKYLIK